MPRMSRMPLKSRMRHSLLRISLMLPVDRRPVGQVSGLGLIIELLLRFRLLYRVYCTRYPSIVFRAAAPLPATGTVLYSTVLYRREFMCYLVHIKYRVGTLAPRVRGNSPRTQSTVVLLWQRYTVTLYYSKSRIM